MIFGFFTQLRSIFTQYYSSWQQIVLSRRAFFQLLGYLGTCAAFTMLAQAQ
ncbi:protein YJL127C-B [Kluyveromyces marxianus]|uniref:Protein YJL127C-B n=1 Tax=Kluyveromyces marxianus TaxID=4911 RepID=A0ABX6F2F8_KLUMA|nr:protein YJL127C-B [Kluyveromyces marxianus]